MIELVIDGNVVWSCIPRRALTDAEVLDLARADLAQTPASHEALVTKATAKLAERAGARDAARLAEIDAERDQIAKVIVDVYPVRRCHEAWRDALDAGTYELRRAK